MGSVADGWDDEERSVIGDKGDIGFIDFADDRSMSSYNPVDEGPIIISRPFPLVKGKPRSGFVGETIFDSVTIQNTTNKSCELWYIQFYDSKPENSFTLSLMEPPSESSDLEYIQEFLESFSLEDRIIRPGQTLTVWISCKPKELGMHTAAVHFSIGDEVIERLAFLLAEDKISQSLASTKPFQRRTKKKQLSSTSLLVNGFVAGSRPASKSSNRGFRNRLADYPIPEDVRELLEINQIPPAIFEGLTKKNYGCYFKTLVNMEEIKLEEDMRSYDMECVTMRSKGSQFLTLEVPGLAEKRPSLVNGDFILAKLASQYGNDATPSYQGYIHRVEAEEVYLIFNTDFHSWHRPGNIYNVQFTYNRTNMKRLYQAIEAAEELDTEFLFPSDPVKKRSIRPTRLVPISDILNVEQTNSVKMILGCKGGPPYVIYGPPGTGKTKTLGEAILQIYVSGKSARVLVCASSNSAADHILDKILSEKSVKVQRAHILRLNAMTRPLDDINPDYLDLCYVEESESKFFCPPLRDLIRYRIIISTYASAASLYAEGVRQGHFSHIILDEAGQASEPETMIPLSHLCRRDTVVVLAGDPKQLGPVIFSKEAEMYGLGKSYLERLFECEFYNNGDENYVMKLVKNYRCHPEILYLPSELFYQGELVACKVDTKFAMTCFDILPNKEFPVLFIGIQGCDEREGNNPSWFNRTEASKVVEIIRNLIENKGLSEEDIGVITPYRQQVLKIKKALESVDIFDIKVGSVEQFQGQEREVIIISTVRSTIKHNDFDRTHCLGFLSNHRRFNVAITRARSLLIAIGNPHIICQDQYWSKFLWHCSEKGSYQGCFLPEKQEFNENYAHSEGEKKIEQSQEGEWGQQSYKEVEWDEGPSQKVEWGEESSQNVEWGQESSQKLEWDHEPSQKGEWDQELTQQKEIPKPVLNEEEWSDGWKD